MINRTVLTETETGTRYHMARYLVDNLDEYPQGRKTLQILALKDPSSRIRRQASAALYQK